MDDKERCQLILDELRKHSNHADMLAEINRSVVTDQLVVYLDTAAVAVTLSEDVEMDMFERVTPGWKAQGVETSSLGEAILTAAMLFQPGSNVDRIPGLCDRERLSERGLKLCAYLAAQIDEEILHRKRLNRCEEWHLQKEETKPNKPENQT